VLVYAVQSVSVLLDLWFILLFVLQNEYIDEGDDTILYSYRNTVMIINMT
jgi:hypothetical protein